MAAGQLEFSVTVGAAGTATFTATTSGRQTWEVQQVSVDMPSAGVSALGMIRKNGYPVTPFVATGDAPGGTPYVTLRPGDKMTIEWTGATVGATGKGVIWYDDGQG